MKRKPPIIDNIRARHETAIELILDFAESVKKGTTVKELPNLNGRARALIKLEQEILAQRS